MRKNTKNDSNAIDEVAITYLSKLLSTSEKTVKSLTDNEDDCLLMIQQASKKKTQQKNPKKTPPENLFFINDFQRRQQGRPNKQRDKLPIGRLI